MSAVDSRLERTSAATKALLMAQNKPVVPDADLRDLRKDYKDLMKAEPSRERAPDLASFTRRAHLMRQLNMAMHTGQLALDEDPEDPDLLVRSYLIDHEDREARLRDLIDLADMGRWLERPDITTSADDHFDRVAADWIRASTPAEARHRLRTLTSMKDRAYADNLHDRVG